MKQGMLSAVLSAAVALVMGGCEQTTSSTRTLQNQAREMFHGYGAWSGDCLHLLSREEVHAESDIVVLENQWDRDESKIVFHPSKNGRIVVFDDPPNRHMPQAVTPCEILFVDVDWKQRVVLYHGPNHLKAVLQTGDQSRACTWIDFPCQSGDNGKSFIWPRGGKGTDPMERQSED